MTCALVLALVLVGAGNPRPAKADTMFGLFPGQNNILTALLYGPTIGQSNDYLADMVTWQGRDNAVVNVYWQLSATNLDLLFDTWLHPIWDTHHSVPMISLNTNNWTNAGIAAGNTQANAAIDNFTERLDDYINAEGAPEDGRRVYIRLNWEPNATFAGYSPAKGATCANISQRLEDYKDAWKHVHDRVMSAGFNATQVQWVYSVYADSILPPAMAAQSGCPERADTLIADAYPDDGQGSAEVDWLGVDGYANPDPTTGALASPAEVFDDALGQLHEMEVNKPVSINEVSASTRNPTNQNGSVAAKGEWIESYLNWVKTKTSPDPIKMSLWFSADITSRDWAIFSRAGTLADGYSAGNCPHVVGTITYNTYCEYQDGIADPLFISSDPANQDRLITDAQFLGS